MGLATISATFQFQGRGLLVVAILVAAGLWSAWRGAAGPPAVGPDGGGHDIRVYAAVTSRVAAGEDYYRVLAEELPARGYATQSIFNWRMPTLAWFNARLFGPAGSRVVIAVLGFITIALWLAVVRRWAPRAAPAGMPLLFTGVPIFLHAYAPYMHELWAGLLIAASVGAWALGRRASALVLGAAALAIRELALPYVLVMAGLAWLESRHREAAAWMIVVALFGVLFAWHATQVVTVMPTTGLKREWLAFGGWSFVLATSHSNIVLFLLPQWVAAVTVPVALVGLWRWANPVGQRLALTVTTYFLLFLAIGQPNNWYWGLLVAPLLPVGCFGWFVQPNSGRPQ